MLNKAPIAGRGKEMKHKVWGWVLAAVAFPVVAQEADGVEWPLPWRIGTTLEYDQVYVSTNRRDGQEFTVKATDVARISIERADADGYVQRWVSTDPKYDLSALPEQARLAVTAAAEALRDLPLDVRLNAEGAYLGLVDLETLRQKYRSAMETAFERILQPYSDQLPSDGEAILARVIDTLTAPSVVEQQFAELPAAYNFVAGGGLAPGVEYAYEDQGLNPLGGDLRNTLADRAGRESADCGDRTRRRRDARRCACLRRCGAAGGGEGSHGRRPKQCRVHHDRDLSGGWIQWRRAAHGACAGEALREQGRNDYQCTEAATT
jgi:hypothetical protein